MPRKAEDLTGQRFGKLVVTGYAGMVQQKTQKISIWHCTCDCGNHVSVATRDLKSGKKRDCGCGKKAELEKQSNERQMQSEAIRQKIREFHEGKLSGTDTLEVWSGVWIGSVLPNVIKGMTIRMYSDTMERHILPFIGDISLEDLTENVLSDWIRHLRKKPLAGDRVMTEGTIRNTFSILSSAGNSL